MERYLYLRRLLGSCSRDDHQRMDRRRHAGIGIASRRPQIPLNRRKRLHGATRLLHNEDGHCQEPVKKGDGSIFLAREGRSNEFEGVRHLYPHLGRGADERIGVNGREPSYLGSVGERIGVTKGVRGGGGGARGRTGDRSGQARADRMGASPRWPRGQRRSHLFGIRTLAAQRLRVFR